MKQVYYKLGKFCDVTILLTTKTRISKKNKH